jgi:endonuclease-3
MLSRCTQARRSRVRDILKLLEHVRGERPTITRCYNCLDVLIESILAQNTNMVNANRGYRQLRRAFGSWTQVMLAPVDEVQRHIAVCGLARMRARRIQSILRRIRERHGKLDLQSLGEMPVREAFDFLMAYHGIGPRTASLTLLFAFNMPVFPVDAGILRLCKRLDLVRAKAREGEAGECVGEMVDPSACRELHVMMFAHAKSMCRPRNPKCRECALVSVCNHGQRRLKHRPADVGVKRETLVPLRLRKPILSRFASAGIPKAPDPEAVAI